MTEGAWEDEPVARPRNRLLAVVAVLLLLALAVGAGIGAGLVQSRRPDSFRSQAVLLLDQEPALTASPSDGLINKLVRLRLKYVDIVQTTTFSDTVATTLSLGPGRVHSALSAVALPASLLVRVSAQDRDAAVAQRIAQTAAESLRDTLSNSQNALSIKPGQQVTLTVVTPARLGTRTTPAEGRVRLIGGVVGGGVLLAGLVVLDVLRRRRRG